MQMFHVWDHFDFTQDREWFKSQGWPLLKVRMGLLTIVKREDLTLDLKSAAQFHLQKLVPDERFNDSTLVVVPCNSPEHVPISLGTSGMIFDSLGMSLTRNDRLCPRAASHLAAIQRPREGLPVLWRR